MKVVMIMKWDGVTPAQYEQVRKSVNWEGNRPKGGVFHVSAFGNNALRITDIWDTADDFNNFVQHRLTPGVKAAGIAGDPQVEIYPLHALYVPAPQELVK